MMVWLPVLISVGAVAQSTPALPPGPPPVQQQTPADNSQVKPALPAQPLEQQQGPQPGAGAQIKTGSAVGTGQQIMNRIGAMLANHQFLDIERTLASDDEASDADGGKKLSAGQSQLYRGVLENRENDPEKSIQALEPLLAAPQAGETPAELKLLKKTLAEDYLRVGEMGKAAQAYQSYAAQVGTDLSEDEKDELELPLKLLPLAANYPAMTVEPGEPFSLPYDRDALGLIDIPVFVDAQSHDWMLDPTAQFNFICLSTAKEVGLKISEESVIVHAITGRPIRVHATLIPRFTLGTVTFRNMTAFVYDDIDYYFPKTGYRVRGVLGYPAISALGSLTVSAHARIEVQPGEKGERLTTGARFFLDGDRVLAALGKPGDERMFVVDAGGQQTYLSSRYFAEHANEFEGKKARLLSVPGAENKPPAPAYVADSVSLLVGDTALNFPYMQVLTQPLGSAAVDDTYGTLGIEALDGLKSYTFDYRTMRFGIKNH